MNVFVRETKFKKMERAKWGNTVRGKYAGEEDYEF